MSKSSVKHKQIRMTFWTKSDKMGTCPKVVENISELTTSGHSGHLRNRSKDRGIWRSSKPIKNSYVLGADGRTDGDECRSAGLPSTRNLMSEKFSVKYGHACPPSLQSMDLWYFLLFFLVFICTSPVDPDDLLVLNHGGRIACVDNYRNQECKLLGCQLPTNK